MDTNDRLDEIKKKLIALHDDKDVEMRHMIADKLLKEAVDLLGRPDITEAYDNIGHKWYA